MTRSALLVAVVYTAALAVWTIGKLALGEEALTTGLIAAGAVLVTQCIVAAIITPWLACDPEPEVLTGLVPLLTTPWPLLLLVTWVAGISAVAVVASQIWVGGLIALSYLSARGLLRVLSEGQWRTIALTALQVAPATVLWAGRETWVPWFAG
jgi:hypothetical protein